MARDLQIMSISTGELLGTWDRCIENALSVKTSVKDELETKCLPTALGILAYGAY